MSKKDIITPHTSWAPDPDITEEKLADMRTEVLDRIIIARVGLLLRHPFFGNMATRMRVLSADDWLQTAAVDGRNLYFNTQFFNAMTNKEIEFVVAHEILHCVFDHLARRDERNHQLYNIAADYIVNNTLVRDRIGNMPKLVKCYQDFKYENWTSEEVYDDLLQKAEDELEKLGELLDDHVNWNKPGDSPNDGEEGEDSKGNATSKQAPTYAESELGKIRDEIRESMLSAAQSAGAGNVPSGVARMIKEFTEPKMNWRELLRQQIQSTVKSDFTFSRPSRKAWHTSAILPGQQLDDTIDICIALDMSGSIGDNQAKEFLSEVKGIMDQYASYQIKLWCFDTKVYNQQEFSADDGESLTDYKIMGGGGTDFDCNWEYMKTHDIQPKKFILFSDMYAWNSFGDPDYCDTIFINHGRTGFEAPFGITVEYSDGS